MGLAYLYVNVNGVGPAHHVSVQNYKFPTDEFGKASPATTWETSSTGTHGENASHVWFQTHSSFSPAEFYNEDQLE